MRETSDSIGLPFQRYGLMFILSSPSGAGKTSLATRLLQNESRIVLSVSCTTRLPRPQEQEGKDYFFVTPEVFHQQVQDGNFLEHAHVFGHDYGTPRAPVYRTLQEGTDVLFDVDWQGAQALYHSAPEHVVRVFILPPSLQELENRLHQRSQDDISIVRYRMSRAREEIERWNEYDYVLVNDHFEDTFKNLQVILHVERLKRSRQTTLPSFINTLTQDSKREYV